jgi:hypothetical protein
MVRTQVMDHKLIFLETKDVVETTLALDNYKRACDCGRSSEPLSPPCHLRDISFQISPPEAQSSCQSPEGKLQKESTLIATMAAV